MGRPRGPYAKVGNAIRGARVDVRDGRGRVNVMAFWKVQTVEETTYLDAPDYAEAVHHGRNMTGDDNAQVTPIESENIPAGEPVLFCAYDARAEKRGSPS